MAESQTEEWVGRVFDRRYRVNGLIGSGGMGSVFRATHLEMNREVALKVLDHGIAESDKQVQRFHLEARASSRLQHPNTIRVFDFGKADDGRLFLAMELLRGETLAELMRREKRLPIARMAHVLRQVCKSLAEAHQIGIVHRDLKPDNIFITEIFGEKDFVKVLDFGIAKSTEGPEQEALTQTGFICGTPRYLSPEQAMGKPVDARSDIYALGVLIYEIMLGTALFPAATPIGIVMRHIREEAPRLPSDGSPAGEALSNLVASMLEKSPSKRPNTASAVAEALLAISQGQAAPLPPTGARDASVSPALASASPAAAPFPPVAAHPAPSRPSAPELPVPSRSSAHGPSAGKTPAPDGATVVLPASAAPPSTSVPASDAFDDVKTRVLSGPVFPEAAPGPPPPPPADPADDYEPTLSRGLDSLPPVRVSPPRAASSPSSPRTPSGMKRGAGLVHRTRSGATPDTGKPAEAHAMHRVARRQPTEEIPLAPPSNVGRNIAIAVVVAVITSVLAYFLFRGQA